MDDLRLALLCLILNHMPQSKPPAKFNVTTDFPHLGLHSAAVSGNIGLVQYALSHGQPINSVLNGVLPLHAACSGGSELVVRTLLAAGADVNAPRLPRRYSNEQRGQGRSAGPLLGAQGSTPLHFAAASGHTHLIPLLLESGADPHAADKHGVIPVMVAESNGHTEAVMLLREAAAAIPQRQSVDEGAAGPSAMPAPRLHLKRSLDNLLHLRSKSHSPHGHMTPRRSTSPTSPTSSIPPLPPLPPTPPHMQHHTMPCADGQHRATLPHISESEPGSPVVPTSPPNTALPPPTPPTPPPPTPRSKPPTTASRLGRRPRSAGSQDTGSSFAPTPSLGPTPPGATTPNPNPQAQATVPNPGRLHKLSSKYSLRNLFKRAVVDSSPPVPVAALPAEDAPAPIMRARSSDESAPPVPPMPNNERSAHSDSSLMKEKEKEEPAPAARLSPPIISPPAIAPAPTASPPIPTAEATSTASPRPGRSRVSSASSGSSFSMDRPPPPLPTSPLPVGRPRKGSEVTAPSPLATVTAWAGDQPEVQLQHRRTPSAVRFAAGEGGTGNGRARVGKGRRGRGDSMSSGGSTDVVSLDELSPPLPSPAPPPPRQNGASSLVPPVTTLSEAQLLVEATQRSILDSVSSPRTGTSLEQQLAAYGESLLLEREFRAREGQKKASAVAAAEPEETNARGGRRVLAPQPANGKKSDGPVLLTYDPPAWLLDDIAARRSPPTPPTPPRRPRPPELQIVSGRAERQPLHRRQTSSSGSGYGSVLEEEGVGVELEVPVRNANGIEIVRTGPTPVSSPGVGPGERAGFPRRAKEAVDEKEDDREEDPDTLDAREGTFKGLTESPSSQTLVALVQPAVGAPANASPPLLGLGLGLGLPPTPTPDADPTTPPSASPPSTSPTSRRFGGLKSFVATLRSR